MDIECLINNLNLKVMAGYDCLKKEISGCYVCDLLSWVISHSSKNNIWITVHTHLNIVAVAMLAEISCIIIPEGIEIEEDTLKKAEEEGVPILSSNLTSFELSKLIGKLGI